MKAKIKRRQMIWMISASMFVAAILPVSAEGQSQWEPNGTNIYYNAGNVGIGTTGPFGLFQVRSATNHNVAVRDVPGSGVQIYAANDGNSAYNTLIFDGAPLLLNPYSGGNVGIGTTSPGWKFVVKDGTNRNLRIASDAGAYGTSGILLQSLNDVNSNFPFVIAGDPIALMTGNVGIGTTSPGTKLHVAIGLGNSAVPTYRGSLIVEGGDTNASATGIEMFSNAAGSGYGYRIASVHDGAAWDDFRIQGRQNSASWSDLFLIKGSNGHVGIGTNDPQYKLDVNGTINSNSTITGNSIVAKYQDVAEWVPSSEQLPAGTVVVLDSTKSNQVTSSSVSYDTRVAGVISAQPGIALGEKSDSKVLVATTGRVKVKVDASKGAIQIGDLLVTSDVPGVAMRSEPVELAGRKMHMPGTLIGKALEPLAKGSGEILVLLSLQ